MADENIPDAEQTAEQPEETLMTSETESGEPADQKRPLKEGLREGAAKAFGLAVEVGSLLGGQSGDIVEAEREVAAAEAEEFIDRIDGEG